MTADGEPRGRKVIEEIGARRSRHRERPRAYRIGFAGLGFLVLGAGIAMLVLPGPGVAVIIVGLAMLALEFAWAERGLVRAVERMDRARDAAVQASPRQRVVALSLLAAAAVLVVAGFWYLDVPFVPG